MAGVTDRSNSKENIKEVSAVLRKAHEGAFFGYQYAEDDSLKKMWFNKQLPSEEIFENESFTENSLQEGLQGEEFFLEQDEMKHITGFMDAYSSVDVESGEQLEGLFMQYAELVYELLSRAVSTYGGMSSDFAGYRSALDGLLLFNSIRIKKENRYLIPENHPIMLMHSYVEKLLEGEPDKQKDDASKDILKAILDCKNRHRKQFNIYSYNQVYQVVDGSRWSFEFYDAIPFVENDRGTAIQAIRLIGKIESYRKTHETEDNRLEKLTIACFGELQGEEELVAVCAAQGIALSIRTFRHERKGSEPYLFAYEDEMYSLSYQQDLEQLFAAYEIVLFLDLNCFFTQRQEEKSVSEKNPQTICEWYIERARECESFKDKAMYYQMIYNYAGMWLNTYESDRSAQYEFDEKLFLSLQTVKKPKTDVYLYISHGDKIAGRSLHDYNICNDEFYDGQQIIVYKFASESNEENAFKAFLNAGEDAETQEIPVKNNPTGIIFVRVDCWKVIKSISNDYYKDIIRQMDKNNSFDLPKMSEMINYFRKTSCILECHRLNEQRNMKITYHMHYDWGTPKDKHVNQTLEATMEAIMKAVLTYAFGKGSMVCVRRFLKELLARSIVTNAGNMSALLIAHLLSKGEYITYNLESGNKDADTYFAEGSFKVRKTFYTLIEKLADLRLRSIPDREGYYVNSFRREVCPELEEEEFRKALGQIECCCVEFGYGDTRLHMNSVL